MKMALLTLLPTLLMAAPSDSAEPKPVELPGALGPVIYRRHANSLGLFCCRGNFAALRFVRTGPDSFEARTARDTMGVMVESPVALDSSALAKVGSALFGLEPAPSFAELMLTPISPAPPPALGPPSTRRATTGAVSFGTLGLGIGLVAGSVLTFNPDSHPNGWTAWRRRNFGVTVGLGAVGAAATAIAGWYVGEWFGRGVPAHPAPRCAIAAYDDGGYPIYEEEIRRVMESDVPAIACISGLGAAAYSLLLFVPLTLSLTGDITSRNNPNGIANQTPVVALAGYLATTAFISHSVGTRLERTAAIQRVRRFRTYGRLEP